MFPTGALPPLAFLLFCTACASAPVGAAGVVIDVTAQGARCDGKTDDAAALRRAAAAVPEGGAELRFPRGACVTSQTIYLKSHTHVVGHGSVLLAASTIRPERAFGYALMENEHVEGGPVQDRDISVTGMTFDYGAFGPVPIPGGGKHMLRFQQARDISVTNNVFQVRGAEDAVAGLGVTNMLVQNNKAFDYRNCAWDFWSQPRDVRVIGNEARTERSAQVVNFNPETGRKERTRGLVADGLIVTGNTLTTTGPKATPMQIEPLGPYTSVGNVRIENNTFNNVYLVLRGSTHDVLVKNNSFNEVAGGPSAIETYPAHDGRAARISVIGNRIVNPHTQAGEVGVIRLEAEDFTLTDNTVTGSGYKAAPIAHPRFVGVEHGNMVK